MSSNSSSFYFWYVFVTKGFVVNIVVMTQEYSRYDVSLAFFNLTEPFSLVGNIVFLVNHAPKWRSKLHFWDNSRSLL